MVKYITACPVKIFVYKHQCVPTAVGLSGSCVQEHAGVLECRGQEETDIWAGGENTGDPPRGKHIRGVGGVQ